MPIDFADEAQALTDTFLDMQLKNRKVSTAPFSGFCLHCGEPVIERRFCDSTCRSNHERDKKLKTISGL